MRWLILALLALALGLPARGFAHEVRPAYLEITERADGKLDVLWKQPSRGLMAVALRPRLDGGGLDRRPDTTASAENFEIARWQGVDLHGGTLDGRVVTIDGLARTITDTLLQVRFKSGDDVAQVLTPANPSFAINAHAGAAVPAYLTLGIGHILTGVDHLLFVFGLLLLSMSRRVPIGAKPSGDLRAWAYGAGGWFAPAKASGAIVNWRQLLRTITAFTIAHSITLAATALKLISPNPALIEAMVAYSILFLAVELVRRQQGKDGLTQRQPWLVAFGFGLLHGAAFAGALKDIGLPEHAIPLSLFLFNLGVEIGQLIFVAAVMAVLWALLRVRWPQGAPRYAWSAASYGIGSFAMFWFLERLHAALDLVV